MFQFIQLHSISSFCYNHGRVKSEIKIIILLLLLLLLHYKAILET